jgi:hypothetical protein
MDNLVGVSVVYEVFIMQCCAEFLFVRAIAESLKAFYSPTDALVNCLKNNFKIYIKINIRTAPTYFGAVTPSSGSALLVLAKVTVVKIPESCPVLTVHCSFCRVPARQLLQRLYRIGSLHLPGKVVVLRDTIERAPVVTAFKPLKICGLPG